MPKNIFQPETPDIGTPTFIQQGVVDKSAAQAITAVGGTALEAHKGYREAQLEIGIDKEIEQFFGGQEAESRIPGQAENVVSLAEQTAGLVSPEEDEALQSAKRDLSRLADMRARGAGSTLELKARVEALTKQYINNYPGMAKDFRQLARENLGDYSDRFALFDKEQKDAADLAKDEQKAWADREKHARRVYQIDTNRPRSEWYPQYLASQGDARTHRELNLLRDTNTVESNLIIEDDERWGAYHQGEAINARTAFSGIADDDTLNADQKATNIQAIHSRLVADINSRWMKGGAVHPRVSALLTDLQSTADLYTKVASGEITAVSANNTVKARLDIAKSQLLDDPQIATAVAGSQLIENAYVDIRLAESVRIKMLGAVKAAARSGTAFSKPGSRTADEQGAVGGYFQLMKGWASAYNEAESKNPDEAKFIVDNIEATLDSWHRDETTPAFDGLLDMVADPDFNTFIAENGTPELKEKLSVPIQTFIMDNVSTAFQGKFDSSTMKIKVGEDGQMYVSATDPKVSGEVTNLNRNYAVRFNKFVKAEAHLQGTTNYKSAMEKLIPLITKGSEEVKKAELEAKVASRVSDEDEEEDLGELE